MFEPDPSVTCSTFAVSIQVVWSQDHKFVYEYRSPGLRILGPHLHVWAILLDFILILLKNRFILKYCYKLFNLYALWSRV
jgi:hypothetical protein